jgi:hypothetical protein
MYAIKNSLILNIRIREAIRMEMNPLILESMWKMKKEQMKKEAEFKETYKLYPEFAQIRKAFYKNYNR